MLANGNNRMPGLGFESFGRREAVNTKREIITRKCTPKDFLAAY